eukprot:2199608-Rhodomonas_salina.1
MAQLGARRKSPSGGVAEALVVSVEIALLGGIIKLTTPSLFSFDKTTPKRTSPHHLGTMKTSIGGMAFHSLRFASAYRDLSRDVDPT